MFYPQKHVSKMPIEIHINTSISKIPSSKWNLLVNPNDPFTTHEFLSALEESNSVCIQTGWQPLHISIQDQNTILAAMPLYLKNHSYGEYIFDWSWAQACQQAGIPYYPKLCSAIPFTPASGERLLFNRQEFSDGYTYLFKGLLAAMKQTQAQSCHVLFCSPSEFLEGTNWDFVQRLTSQYHWINPFSSKDPANFENWLNLFTRKGRKDIRQERTKAQKSISKIYWKQGHELQKHHIDKIYHFYMDTCSRKWGSPYLESSFFDRLQDTLAHLTWVCFAEIDDQIVASSLFFQRGSHLYGRYWGCEESVKFLHFELCYHQPIELCLQMGWKRFEAGAQGNHKLKRGLLAQPTYSLHHLSYQPLHHGVYQAVQQENSKLIDILHTNMMHAPIKSEFRESWSKNLTLLQNMFS